MNIVTGNLFDFADTHALAHGVNCVGIMGGGIAAQFAQRYPEMKTYYTYVCHLRGLHPGTMLPWMTDAFTSQGVASVNHHILNCASQYLPGGEARLDFLTRSLTLASGYCQVRGLPLAIPEIGCGIGKLDPVEAYRVFEEIGKSVDLTVVKYG